MTGIVAVAGCSRESFNDFFTLRSVSVVQNEGQDEDIEELKEKARGYEKEINRHIEAGDKAGDVYELLGTKYLHHQNWELAVESLKKAVSYGNGSDDVHRRLGAAYANRARESGNTDDYRSAHYHYEHALEKNSENTRARFGLAMVLFYGLDEQERGMEEVKRAVKADPSLYQARFAYGRMLYELDQKNSALQVYQNLRDDLKQEKGEEYRSQRRDVETNIHQLTVELSNNESQ